MRRLREEKQWSRVQLADRVGRSESWIAKVESGTQRGLAHADIEKLANALGVPYDELRYPHRVDLDFATIQTSIIELLSRYYSADPQARAGRFECTVDGTHVTTAFWTKADWLNLRMPISLLDTGCQFSALPRCPLSEPQPHMSRLHEMVMSFVTHHGMRIGHGDLYRLVALDLNTKLPRVTFALDDYYRYRMSVGVLREELLQALAACAEDPKKAWLRREELLPLRNVLLPATQPVDDFSTTLFAGGCDTVLALASDDPVPTFEIPLAIRSKEVAHSPGLIHVAPSGMHEPSTDPTGVQDVKLSLTIFNELYEELLGGDEAEQVKHTRPGWFFHHIPMSWFPLHSDKWDLSVTCFGVELVAAQYLFGTLLLINDPSALELPWKRNWEQHIKWIKTHDREALTRELLRPDWVTEGFVEFVQALQVLHERDPKRVALPDIEVLHPC